MKAESNLLGNPTYPPCVFLDRDGVINKELYDYVKRKEDFILLKDVGRAIKLLNENKILVIVISNQGGIGKGLYSKEALEEIDSLMKEELAKDEAYLDAIYYCPHSPDDKCPCRKPEIGMFLSAKSHFSLNLHDCIMIGDKMIDIEGGEKAGCKTCLVLTGYGKELLKDREDWKVEPDLIAEDLYSAVKLILKIRG